jgi:HK97 family phage prohead protease
MTQFVPQLDFHRLARAGQARGRAVLRVSTIKPRVFNDGSRRIRFCFSDNSVDRYGDTVNSAGWELANFRTNPVALWAHQSDEPPIGRASNVGLEGNRLMGDITFADANTYAFADTIYRLYVGGFLNAVSVGFLPIEYSFVENDPDRGWGIDFQRQELLEISPCPIPANANALLAEAKSLGLGPRDTNRLRRWTQTVERERRSAPVTDFARARRDRDLARCAAIAARVGRRGVASVPAVAEDDRAQAIARQQQAEADARGDAGRRVAHALALAAAATAW